MLTFDQPRVFLCIPEDLSSTYQPGEAPAINRCFELNFAKLSAAQFHDPNAYLRPSAVQHGNEKMRAMQRSSLHLTVVCESNHSTSKFGTLKITIGHALTLSTIFCKIDGTSVNHDTQPARRPSMSALCNFVLLFGGTFVVGTFASIRLRSQCVLDYSPQQISSNQ